MAHDGCPPSRAMDMCGLVYCLVYMHDEVLPWMRVKVSHRVELVTPKQVSPVPSIVWA
jgi:hypothetical protein